MPQPTICWGVEGFLVPFHRCITWHCMTAPSFICLASLWMTSGSCLAFCRLVFYVCLILPLEESNCFAFCECAQSVSLCPTLCDPMNCIPPGSSVHGISQARILLQGIFPAQRSNLRVWCLLHWQVDSLPPYHLRSPVLWLSLVLQKSKQLLKQLRIWPESQELSGGEQTKKSPAS